MERILISTTVFALAALAAGCGSGNPVGPAEPSSVPSLSGVGPGDRNGNGIVCGRWVGDEPVPGVVGSYGAPGYVLVDDRDGDCPRGFSRWANV